MLRMHRILLIAVALAACADALVAPRCAAPVRRGGHEPSSEHPGLRRRVGGVRGRPRTHTGRSSRLHVLSWLGLGQKQGAASSASSSGERDRLKRSLLDLCRAPGARPPREAVERLIQQLAPLSPTPEAARSTRLQKQWNLLWTTEKEINVFLDWGIAERVTQTIRGADLGNEIRFRNGGSLAVAGALAADGTNPRRTAFEFTGATLDVGWRPLPALSLPPVGRGWFDTVYLDDELRVDLNSRDDILVCLAEND